MRRIVRRVKRARSRVGVPQKVWNDRYIGILKNHYRKIDSTISMLLNDEGFVRTFAPLIQRYVDKAFTKKLYRERKVREAAEIKHLEGEIAALQSASLHANGDLQVIQILNAEVERLSGRLERCKVAFATKRLGRDRAHVILYSCRLSLESHLNKRVTCPTLAYLVNAAQEVEGDNPNALITEEQIRKNMMHLEKNSPVIANQIRDRFPRPSGPTMGS